MSFSSLRVGTRLSVGFLIVLSLMLATTLIGLFRLSSLNSEIETIVQEDYARIALVNTMRDAVRFQAVALRDVVMQEDLAFKKSEVKLMKEARKKYQEASEALSAMPSEDAISQLILPIKTTEQAVAEQVAQVMEATMSDDHATAQKRVRNDVRPKQLELIAQLETLLKALEAKTAQAAEDSANSYKNARNLLLILAAAALAAGAVIALSITRSIVAPLKQANSMAQAIAQGDLTHQAKIEGSDEFADLLVQLNAMNRSLHETMRQLANCANGIARSANMLSGAASEGSRQAEEKSDLVMQASAAMEELTVSTGEVASGAETVSGAAEQARKIAGQGHERMTLGAASAQQIADSVNFSSQAISALSEQINKVSEITQVIKEIADQTNLLALNAAIEAARAGEQGRGFAVVADEVRKLAERTAASTLSITETVSAIGLKTNEAVDAMQRVSSSVGESVQFNQDAQAIFQEIVTAAASVAEQAHSIALATNEQKNASATTASSMERINQLSEENAAGVRRIDTAAHELNQTADALQLVVNRFRI